jgi:subfamily B ATP-binding cassette protein MsbA
VVEALERLMKGRTVITIAHRLSTIRDADKIIVIDEGVVAESGTHDELMTKAGIYAGLHHAQFDQ